MEQLCPQTTKNIYEKHNWKKRIILVAHSIYPSILHWREDPGQGGQSRKIMNLSHPGMHSKILSQPNEQINKPNRTI